MILVQLRGHTHHDDFLYKYRKNNIIMPAIVTDQFRILNASNFVAGVSSSTNSYYVSVGLPNPAPSSVGFGRQTNWNTATPNPVDSFSEIDHIGDTTQFGKRVTEANVRRLVRRIDWTKGIKYDMYRQDYSTSNTAPNSNATRLYDANYYVMNSNFNVYICIENGSSGINTTGNASEDEPTFTDLEPSKAGESQDGYVWKYLFTVNPSDIIKFDSTDFIALPNNWPTSTDAQIQAVRENGDSDINNNQIKTVFIADQGDKYTGTGGEFDILGDGTGGKVVIEVTGQKITNATVSSGGKGYSYGIVDLSSINSGAVQGGTPAKLIPIIPPSRGHGFDLYKELGADRVLVYARFDDSTKDFPIDSKFAQVSLIKNPTSFGTTSVYTGSTFSSLKAIKLSTISGTPTVGGLLQQTVGTGETAFGYISSFDNDTNVIKYIQDRSLYFGNGVDQTDVENVKNRSTQFPFESTTFQIAFSGGTGSVETTFSSGITTDINNNNVALGVSFTSGLASPEINKGSGDVLYIDNRALISRNLRQKEDVKIILEF